MSIVALTRYGATRGEIEALLDSWREPRYRAAQLWDSLYAEMRPLDDVTTRPRKLRARLSEALPLALESGTWCRAPEGVTVCFDLPKGSSRLEI